MTHRRPPPPRRQRYVWPLLGGAAFVGLCGLIGAAHPVVQADAAPVTVTPPTVSPSAALQAPSLPVFRSLSPVTVFRTAEVTLWRSVRVLAPTTQPPMGRATVTETQTATTTRTVTATVTATVTSTAPAPTNAAVSPSVTPGSGQ